jgi:uncharacterized membrane protein
MVEIIPNWHPIFVHFTVALVFLSGALFVLSRLVTNWRLEDQWLATAYWSLWIGALISVGTVIAGWYAFNSVEHDTVAHEAMIEHRNLALVTFIVIAIMAIWSLVQYVKEQSPSLVFLGCMVLSVATIGSTAWHGGELVYRHGLGVMSLPQKNEHGHTGAESHAAPAEEHSHDSALAEDAAHSH